MGRNKAELVFDGLPLWRHQWRTLVQTGAAEVFVAGGNEGFPGDVEVVGDDVPDGGPLTGLRVALQRARHDWLLVLAVDLPAMTAGYLGGLVGRAGPGWGVMPRRGGRFEPLVAVYPREALAVAEACRRENRPALQEVAGRLVDQNRIRLVDVAPDEEALFFNVNTPGEWEGFLAKNPQKKSDRVRGDPILGGFPPKK